MALKRRRRRRRRKIHGKKNALQYTLRDIYTRECFRLKVQYYYYSRGGEEKEDARCFDARRNAKRGGGDGRRRALETKRFIKVSFFRRRRSRRRRSKRRRARRIDANGASCWRKKSPRKNTEKTRRINRRTWKRKRRVCEKMPSPQRMPPKPLENESKDTDVKELESWKIERKNCEKKRRI